ncbi:hypothetical protein [Deinococcus sp. Marseille-Q6407]|uniref:hypothetical protein n=1 Tax=Deinococcus sp. Marseille-Q6407 TaxID=2969223 RepID=UPI0021C1B033|nr:hypothetical protein [Deinococcus sp. Marseille-Q6407]
MPEKSRPHHGAPCGTYADAFSGLDALEAWRSAYPARAALRLVPDAVTDTARRRAAGAARLKERARQIRRAAGAAPLAHLVMPMPGNLYDPAACQNARAAALRLLNGAPALVVLETAPSTGLHAHIITPAAGWAGIWWRPVERGAGNLHRLLAYVSKPADALACRSEHHRCPADAEGAARRYLAARRALWAAEGRRRLPRRVFTLNLRRAAPRSALVSLRYRLEAARAALEAARAACAALEAARRAACAAALEAARAARPAALRPLRPARPARAVRPRPALRCALLAPRETRPPPPI